MNYAIKLGFDPGPWPDGWIGFDGADERLYFDCRGQDSTPYTVWSIVTLDASEADSGVVPSGPEDLPTAIDIMIGRANDYFERGVTPVPV